VFAKVAVVWGLLFVVGEDDARRDVATGERVACGVDDRAAGVRTFVEGLTDADDVVPGEIAPRAASAAVGHAPESSERKNEVCERHERTIVASAQPYKWQAELESDIEACWIARLDVRPELPR
jgi:hypothetical protein